MSGERLVRLRGAETDLAAALELWFARGEGEVVAVLETEGQREVRFRGTPPDFQAQRLEIEITELDTDALVEATGLEDDRVIHVTEDLIVRPPWVAPPTGFSGTELIVPRANAFGSGEHGSTRAALIVMHRLLDESVTSLADVGTGSGILALFAVTLGCRTVLACDIDPQAVAAAVALLPEAKVSCGGPDELCELGASVDCVVANMFPAEILASLDDLVFLWNRRGPLILSGMREAEMDEVYGAVRAVAPEASTVGGWTEVDGYVAFAVRAGSDR